MPPRLPLPAWELLQKYQRFGLHGIFCGLQPGEFIHTLGDAHLYNNHVEQARLQLTREPHALPTLRLNPSIKALDDFAFSDIAIENYTAHSAIKAPVAV